ncbi:hypothetical protein K3495_g559 [Podosphaera aphanis]|nr:hypothetical protein K3495_g559 [Podosphaera aphanis]
MRKRDFAATQGVYIPLGPPPAKRAAPPVSNERTGGPDFDDDNNEEEIYSEEGEGVDKGPDTGRGDNQPTFFGGFDVDGTMDDDFLPTPSITCFGKTPTLRRKARFQDGAELHQFIISNFIAPVFGRGITGDEESDDDHSGIAISRLAADSAKAITEVAQANESSCEEVEKADIAVGVRDSIPTLKNAKDEFTRSLYVYRNTMIQPVVAVSLPADLNRNVNIGKHIERGNKRQWAKAVREHLNSAQRGESMGVTSNSGFQNPLQDRRNYDSTQKNSFSNSAKIAYKMGFNFSNIKDVNTDGH